MKLCKKCKKQVSNKSKICKHCGADVSKAKIIVKNTPKSQQKKQVQKKEDIKETVKIEQPKNKENKKQQVKQPIKKEQKETKLTKKTKVEKQKLNKRENKILKKLNQPKTIKRICILLTIIIILTTITITVKEIYTKTFNPAIEVEKTDNPKTFQIGDTIKYKDVTYKITKVETNTKGTTYKKPKKGNQYIIVTFEYENKSDQTIKHSPKSWKIQNEQQKESQRLFTGIDVETALYGGKLVIGAKKIGTLVFEQPKKYTDFKMNYYELDLNEETPSTKEEQEQKPIFSIKIKLPKEEPGNK